ncbi:DMT family transporter [Salipiger sp. H15]|uniref:DMT family transporter n=1 Tax=Alloyangia sp. H15 TaxID=3029062 RepID=A0AAU8ACG1_9RHOB
MAIASREDRTALGLGLMALGVLGFTCIDTSAKWLLQHGVPALQVVWCRYAAHLVLVLVAFLPREGASLFRTRHPWKQAFRAAGLFGSTMLNFIALAYLPITVTTTIMFAGPVVVTLLAIPMLGERVGKHRIAAVCVGFLGVLVVMQPWGAEFHPAMLLSLGALCSAAIYFILTRQMAGEESNGTLQVWGGGLPTLLLAPFVLPAWETPATTGTGVMLAVIGVFGAVAHMLATAAHRYADASVLAPMVYLQLMSAAVAGLLVFGTWPTPWTLVGAMIIISAGLYIWHRERRRGVPHSKITPRL